MDNKEIEEANVWALLDRIQRLETHKTFQIDENRKISRRVDEINKRITEIEDAIDNIHNVLNSISNVFVLWLDFIDPGKDKKQ